MRVLKLIEINFMTETQIMKFHLFHMVSRPSHLALSHMWLVPQSLCYSILMRHQWSLSLSPQILSDLRWRSNIHWRQIFTATHIPYAVATASSSQWPTTRCPISFLFSNTVIRIDLGILFSFKILKFFKNNY